MSRRQRHRRRYEGSDEVRAAAEQRLAGTLHTIETMRMDLECAELVEAERDRLQDTLVKTEDEQNRRPYRY